MKEKISKAVPYIASLIIAFVFLSSLPYKFSNAPETATIFGKLDAWASTFGMSGLFSQSGLFGAYAIGSVELIASVVLLLAFIPMFRHLQKFGALLAFAIMSGAVFFHLCTPLGIDPNNDGGGLFVMAVVSWVCALYLVYIRRADFLRHVPNV